MVSEFEIALGMIAPFYNLILAAIAFYATTFSIRTFMFWRHIDTRIIHNLYFISMKDNTFFEEPYF